MKRLWRKVKFRHPSAGNAISPETERLVGLLQDHGIDHVLDVGGNVGQYASRLRAGGYCGRITSFEPLSRAHGEMTALAAGDARWAVAPRMALASVNGRAAIRVSNRSDMSSLKPMAERKRPVRLSITHI